jgi:hypothetical protein
MNLFCYLLFATERVAEGTYCTYSQFFGVCKQSDGNGVAEWQGE